MKSTLYLRMVEAHNKRIMGCPFKKERPPRGAKYVDKIPEEYSGLCGLAYELKEFRDSYDHEIVMSVINTSLGEYFIDKITKIVDASGDFPIQCVRFHYSGEWDIHLEIEYEQPPEGCPLN